MSQLKIYGVPTSRARRTLWMARELGLDHENIPVRFDNGETRAADFLALNPNGHVPVIDDDGFILWESMAINLYLARKHDTLWPATIEGEGLAFQWSFWVMTEVEKPIIAILFHRVIFPEGKRDTAMADSLDGKVQAPLKVLDDALAKSPYLTGDDFTVADLNVASLIGLAPKALIDMAPFSHITDWLDRCLSRPNALSAI